MNRVAVVARYISDHSFILLYFHSFLNINLYLKKYSYIYSYFKGKSSTGNERDRLLSFFPLSRREFQ